MGDSETVCVGKYAAVTLYRMLIRTTWVAIVVSADIGYCSLFGDDETMRNEFSSSLESMFCTRQKAILSTYPFI
ncbi:hypothetical protein TNCV_4502741 [Trichonephila clavipes]|nr:hypothetical protein TNCV_4502741 [Trichonephila clavipes]